MGWCCLIVGMRRCKGVAAVVGGKVSGKLGAGELIEGGCGGVEVEVREGDEENSSLWLCTLEAARACQEGGQACSGQACSGQACSGQACSGARACSIQTSSEAACGQACSGARACSTQTSSEAACRRAHGKSASSSAGLAPRGCCATAAACFWAAKPPTCLSNIARSLGAVPGVSEAPVPSVDPDRHRRPPVQSRRVATSPLDSPTLTRPASLLPPSQGHRALTRYP